MRPEAHFLLRSPECDYVIHTASPYHMEVSDPENQLVVRRNGTGTPLEISPSFAFLRRNRL